MFSPSLALFQRLLTFGSYIFFICHLTRGGNLNFYILPLWFWINFPYPDK